MGHSVLQVPVPGLEPFVRARTEYYDDDYLSSDADFTHAHITVLGPFLDVVDAESAAIVAEIAASMAPFSYHLDRLATFANGCIHLRPEPDAAFRELTQRLVAAFPDCPPYDGRFPDSVPHLTLDLAHAEVTEASTQAQLASYPQVEEHRAERIDLAWYEPGHCHLRSFWQLGG